LSAGGRRIVGRYTNRAQGNGAIVDLTSLGICGSGSGKGFRGRTGIGLGARLVDLAKSRRPAGLQLWRFVTNIGARRFYERHGFVVAEVTDGSGNEENEPDVRFIWTNP
jgi:hypothetical protein